MAKKSAGAAGFLRIKEVLEEKRKTQVWLAGELDKDIVTVSRYVNGHREPGLAVLFQIARILKVDPGELLKR